LPRIILTTAATSAAIPRIPVPRTRGRRGVFRLWSGVSTCAARAFGSLPLVGSALQRRLQRHFRLQDPSVTQPLVWLELSSVGERQNEAVVGLHVQHLGHELHQGRQRLPAVVSELLRQSVFDVLHRHPVLLAPLLLHVLLWLLLTLLTLLLLLLLTLLLLLLLTLLLRLLQMMGLGLLMVILVVYENRISSIIPCRNSGVVSSGGRRDSSIRISSSCIRAVALFIYPRHRVCSRRRRY